MHLPDPHGHGYYTTFYVLAVLTTLVLALYEGQRRRYPLRPWLVLLACWLLAFIVGTKLITIPVAAWLPMLQGRNWPVDTARSVLGGALGGGLVLLTLRRWLGFGWSVFDALALPLAAGLVVQCIGCLLTGCCFGVVSSGGLVYAAGTPPWWAQVAAGLIPATALQSLPVVPTQLYAMALCLGTAVVLGLLRNRLWPAGSWALLQTGLLLLGRFALGFYRDPASEPVAAQSFTLGSFSMLGLQWLVLPLGLLAVLGWAWRHRVACPPAEPEPENRPLRHLLAVLGLLLFAALFGPGALTLPEVMVVKALLLAVLALEAGAWLFGGSPLQGAGFSRLAPVPVALASVVLLSSQVEPTPERPAAPSPPAPELGSPGKGLTITVGTRQGNYNETIVNEGGCGSSRYEAQYEHDYRVAGGEVAYTFNGEQNGLPATGGLGVWLGTERQTVKVISPGSATFFPVDSTYTNPLLSINPYIAGERVPARGFGFGYRVGMHLGKLSYPAPDYNQLPRHGFTMAPDLMVWMGVRRKLFGQLDIGTGLNGVGSYTLRQGIGSGLGTANGSHILGGLAVALHNPEQPQVFIGGRYRVPNTGFSIEPFAATNFSREHQFNLEFHYRLSLKK